MENFFLKRVKLAREKLIEEQVLFLSSEADVTYYTGFTGDSSWLLLDQKEAVFITDGRYTEQIRLEKQIPLTVEVINSQRKTADILKEFFEKNKKTEILLDKSRISLSFFEILQKSVGNDETIFSQDDITRCLRMKKDSLEIEIILQNLQITEWGYQTILPAIKEGMSEKEVAALLEFNLKKQGAEKPAFDTIIASGPRSAMPHGTASDKIIRENDLILFDFGVFADGYASDFTRCFSFGKIMDPKINEIHKIVFEAVQAAEDKIRPGVTAAEVHKAAWTTIDKKGYSNYFTHSTGHGVGLEIHEYPRIADGVDTVLEEGMVFTIEPGIYLPELGGIRLEDMVLVNKKGHQVLTTSDYSL